MFTRIRPAFILIISLVVFTLAFADPFFSEPQAIAENKNAYGPHEQEMVFQSVVNSFDLLAALMKDVSYAGDSVYPTVNKASNFDAAIEYLSAGFQPELAASIANYYFGWDEESARLVLIPTDSIPMITADDQGKVQITFISEHQAVLQRIYENCYAGENQYLYSVYVDKLESGWIISDFSWEETTGASQ